MRRLRRGGRRRSGRHPFLYVKRQAKVRYRGLAKNTQRLVLLLGLTLDGALGRLTGAKCDRDVSDDMPRQSRFIDSSIGGIAITGTTVSDNPLAVYSIRLTQGCSEFP